MGFVILGFDRKGPDPVDRVDTSGLRPSWRDGRVRSNHVADYAGGTLSQRQKKVHQTNYLPTVTALSTEIYENEPVAVEADTTTEYQRHVEHQITGIEQSDGTYAFTIERGVKAYWLKKMLHSFVSPEQRRKFRENPEAMFREHQLTEVESTMVRNLVWRAMIHYGVIFLSWRSSVPLWGSQNLHIHTAMRGEPVEILLKSSCFYLVASRWAIWKWLALEEANLNYLPRPVMSRVAEKKCRGAPRDKTPTAESGAESSA